MEYVFALKYQLADDDRDLDAWVERLAEAGCDDAMVGVGQPGRLALEFTREAESADAAMYSALADVRRAAPSAKLIEAAPDWVGLTEVAEIVNMSRQNIRKLMLSHPDSFPTPVHQGVRRSGIWLMCWPAAGPMRLRARAADAGGGAGRLADQCGEGRALAVAFRIQATGSAHRLRAGRTRYRRLSVRRTRYRMMRSPPWNAFHGRKRIIPWRCSERVAALDAVRCSKRIKRCYN